MTRTAPRPAIVAAALAGVLLATGALVAVARTAPAGAAAARTVVVVSTSDVQGKTGPCGCHVPKGGLARLASFADSTRLANPNLLLVTAGGFFPLQDDAQDVAAFFLETMRDLGVTAAGVSEPELRYGRAFLLVNAKRTGAPLTCANLVDRATGRPLVAPWRIAKAGGTSIGIFALVADHAELGAARDSVTIEEPAAAARRTIAELRAKGASAIVLLSALDKVATEDLVTAVPGIDLAIAGRKVPVLQTGRAFGHTIVCYGGEQGQYAGRARLWFGAGGALDSTVAETVTLGPEVGDQDRMLARVHAFDEVHGAKLRRLEKERAARSGASSGGVVDSVAGPGDDKWLGAKFCGRCHGREYAQWQETPHAQAWQALVDAKADQHDECASCHVVGFHGPNGFRTDTDAPRLGGVQCESCHGMGTRHEAWPAKPQRVAEATCRACHTPQTSPDFALERWKPYVDHTHAASALPALGARRPMHAAAPVR